MCFDSPTWYHFDMWYWGHGCLLWVLCVVRYSGIRTHDLSRRAAVYLRLRPGGHWDRHFGGDTTFFSLSPIEPETYIWPSRVAFPVPIWYLAACCIEKKIFILYRVSQELRSLFRYLIPELILSQKRHIHMGPIRNGSGIMIFNIFNILIFILYRVSQDLRSLFRYLIPELILSQKVIYTWVQFETVQELWFLIFLVF